MAKNLVIVESPAKAKTIEGFLGKDFTVKSSYGHVRDLSEKGISVDVKNNFEPKYEISADKKKVISELKDLVKKSETVWLASDEDREGEAIAWHLKETLNLEDGKTRRIVFNEITKNAILKAIEKPRQIDLNLVNAQQARRVLDRLVGYEISPVLWKKVKPSLSAGRVQSVAVRLIVERERERSAFKSVSAFRVTGVFKVGSSKIRAELNKRFATEKEALDFLEKCTSADFSIGSVETKPGKRTPAAPFTTSTLQQEAGRKLGYSVTRTMTLAQKLYEEGKITYMRTDSVNLSDTALEGASAQIGTQYGDKYIQTRKFTTKSKGAQEAHEAIRPTHFEELKVSTDSGAQKLYELIWKRTVASQMADAVLEKTTVEIQGSGLTEKFVARGEVIKFDGFLKVYMESTDEEEEEENDDQILPAVKKGDALQRQIITAVEKFSIPPARYTEASLVKKLEELGIGRPSTYAPTITTIQKRGYVERKDLEGTPRNYSILTLEKSKVDKEVKTEMTGADRNKLFPTDIGTIVTDFLTEHFKQILDYNFTARVEKEFDEIAEGLMEWQDMLKDFYGPFHETVEHTEKHSERAKGKRELGVDPASGKNVYALIGRYGPMAQIGEAEDEEKPRFASLQKNQSIETITLEEALSLFKLPKPIGIFEDEEMVVGVGRFGPYVRHAGKFYSLPKGADPLDFQMGEAIKLIEEKRIADSNKTIKEFEGTDIQVLNGRFGPYIKQGKENYKIPKGTEPAALTLEEVQKIIAEAPAKKPKKKAR
ncbi:MAG: type I DNA topoisomerase [Flavobacteriales bacterium]